MFGDLADCFCNRVFANLGGSQTRLDIVFYEYRHKSIKADTWASRSAKRRKIRILMCVMCVYLQSGKHSSLPADYKVVVSGGDRFLAVPSSARLVSHLNSSHEETDTKIALYCAEANAQSFHRVVVYSRDTDVLLLLIYHATAEEVCLSAGTTKEKKSSFLCILFEKP